MTGTSYNFPSTSATNLSIDAHLQSNDGFSNQVHESGSNVSADRIGLPIGTKCSKILKRWGIKSTKFTIVTVFVFGLSFNAPRWFEWELINDKRPMDRHFDFPNTSSYGTDITFNSNETLYSYVSNDDIENVNQNTSSIQVNEDYKIRSSMTVRPTSLKTNPLYGRYYNLIGSCVVMVIIPVAILLTTYCSFRKAMPSGSSKTRTHKVMLIIIMMFLLCHCPKVRIS